MRILFSILSCLFILLLASSCHTCCNFFGEGEWVKKIDGSEATHVIQEYITYLRHVKRLRLEGSGVYYHDSIHAFRMEFISMDVMELCEARELMVDIVEGLLSELNSNPILAPQFLDYPLTADSLEIFVRFESFENEFVDQYYMGWMSLRDGVVSLYAGNIKEDNRNIWDYRIEPYFKSREFVLYAREAEDLFHTTCDLEYPTCLRKEQYCPEPRVKPRYWSNYLTPGECSNPF